MGLRHAFIAHLKLRGLWQQYEMTESDLCIRFNTPTNFAILREQQVFQVKSENFSTMSQNEGIANSYAQRYYLNYSDSQMAENREWLRKDAELQWEIERIRTEGPDFYDNQDTMAQAEADILGGGGGGGGALGGFSPDTPPDFGPGPAGDQQAGGAPQAGAPVAGAPAGGQPPAQ